MDMLQMMQSQGNPQTARMRQMINNLKAMRNPQAAVMNMINQNPELKAVLDASNGNYKHAFYTMAKQKGVNPDEIISMLK